MAFRLLLVLFVLAPTAVRAQSDGLVHACVRQGNGKVRIVAAGTSCKAKEAAVRWPAQSADVSGFFTKAESDGRYLAAGGTAVSAQSATTCGSAQTAASAATSQSAESAATCDYATAAGAATTCDHATAAGSASTCDTATTAGSAATCATADTAIAALDAQRVGGVTLQPFAWEAALGDTPAIVVSLGGLALTAACVWYDPLPEVLPPTPAVELTPSTAVDDAIVHSLLNDQAPVAVADFDVADAGPIIRAIFEGQGRLAYATPDGGVVLIDWMAASFAFGTGDCIARGVARWVPPAS